MKELTTLEKKEFEDFFKTLPPNVITIIILSMAMSIFVYLMKHWKELKLDELVKKDNIKR